LLNYATKLTKFRQSNLTSLANGSVSITCISLYPLEKWFVRNSMKPELLLDMGANFALGVSDKRIDFIQGITDYFEDLEREYNFYRQIDGKLISLKKGQYRYKLVRHMADIESYEAKDEIQGIKTIFLIVSIEGLHVLNTGLRVAHDPQKVMQNLETIRNWEYRPFFITIAHHFWNHFCGHAASLSGLILKYTDQSEGINTGFTPLGLDVLKRMLDNSDGKRIIPDVKHMSPQAREEYYALLDSESGYTDVPIIISHGACNGLRAHTNRVVVHQETGAKLNPIDINFFDEELIRIVRRGGILGLQLDERRIVNKETKKKVKKSLWRKKIRRYRSELLWYQLEHICRVLDAEQLPAWDHIAIGSDFDGIIDSLNGFWTAEELPALAEHLEEHADRFLSSYNFKNASNRIEAPTLISKLIYTNARKFLETHFINQEAIA
ncbi:MAG: peptidase M19, partial [Eudoraea sp.]|nr:peptidase M19 [Eudoraea sp.]